MNRIAPLLLESNILLDAERHDQEAAVRAGRRNCSRTTRTCRRRWSSTACRRASGWVRPGSARASRFRTAASRACKEALGAFVRPQQPIPFDAPDGRPVTQVFVLLVPEQATEEHLQILSELAQMFSDKAFRDRTRRDRPMPRACTRCLPNWESERFMSAAGPSPRRESRAAEGSAEARERGRPSAIRSARREHS